MFPYKPTSIIKDLYAIINALEWGDSNPQLNWRNISFDARETKTWFAIPSPWYCSGMSLHGRSIWQFTLSRGRHLKYTRWNCFRSLWGDMTTVAMPHIIPGCSWWAKLFHARSGGSGRDLIWSAHMKPFFAISRMCVPPLDVEPEYIPSIKDASLLRRVGIGANVPSSSGTLKCDGAILPDGCVIGAIEAGRALTVLNFAHPQLYQWDRN